MNTVVLDRTTCQQITTQLIHILADTYVLYLKTQNFHWNVVDPRFHSLHELFEEQYEQLAEATDIIAERIRMLGSHTPASMNQFLKQTSLEEAEGHYSGDEMLQLLLADHETCANQIRSSIEDCNRLNDAGTSDMLVARLREHEKAAWMIRSHLKK